MKTLQYMKEAGTVTTLLATVAAAALFTQSSLHAQDPSEALLIQQGLQITPVPLNLAGLDTNLVGLGSFLVNAVGDCNGCHTAGGPPNFNYAPGKNPYFNQPKKVDPTVYLDGGDDFGAVGTPTGDNKYAGPDIIARNLTPDNTGMPVGGRTLAEFVQIMRTGVDLDHAHPTCTTVTPTPQPANCIPASPDNPVDGDLLQVMPWPTFQNMSDHYLEAIYAYLSAIPCLSGSTDASNLLYNNCSTGGTTTPPPNAVTAAVANPNNVTIPYAIAQLDGTSSTSADGKPLLYQWALSATSLPAVILNANTAMPTVQFGPKGTYLFVLTVTDDTGNGYGYGHN